MGLICSRSFLRSFRSVALILCVALFHHVHAASSDAYIDALNAEIQAPAAESEAESKPAFGVATKKKLVTELTPDQPKKNFESELKNNFFGSYLFYNKLDNTGKEAVYKYYLQNNSITDIRNKITELLKK